jgi:tRNA dimethylallyltransferase
VLRLLAGEWSQEQAAAQTVRATQRFARRQESWFRRDPRITWLDGADPAGHGADLAGRALATIRSCGLPRATGPGTTS